MNQTSITSREFVFWGTRRAALAAWLCIAVPVATSASELQESPLPQKPLAAPTTVAKEAPTAVLLKCKVVRASVPGQALAARSKKEPVVSEDKPPRIVSAPIIRTLAGMVAEIGISHDGTEVRIKLLPALQKNGDYKLTVEPGVTVGTKWQHSYVASELLHPNEWVRCQLEDAGGNYLGLQLLVQVVPVTDAP